MLDNLLAMLALLDDKLPTAQIQLSLVDPIPGVRPAARRTVALNRAFLAVAATRSTEARTFFKTGETLAASINLPDFDARITVLGGLVAWSAGDTMQEPILPHRHE